MKSIRFHHKIFRFILCLMMVGAVAAPSSWAQAEGGVLDQIDSFMAEGPLAQLKAQALENYGLMINPYFKMGLEFTSNVFKRPEPDRQDTLWTYAPGVNITHVSDMGEIGLSYESQFRYFTRHEKQNEQDQSFAVYADLYPTDRINLKISEELVQQGATAGAQGVEPLNFTDNTVTTAMIYAVDERTDAEVGYKNFSREYAGDLFDPFSYIENEFYFRGYYDLTDERTTVYSGYHIGWFDYDETTSRNATYHEFPVGLRGILPGDIQYDAHIAAHIRNQEADVRNDFWAFIGGIDLKKQLTADTAVGGGFLRRPVEATYNNATLHDEKLFYGNLTHRLNKKTRARFDISWANRDFENSATVGATTAKRDDDVFALGLGIDYALRSWMVLNLDYRVERRDSNMSAFDYTENRLVLGATMPL